MPGNLSGNEQNIQHNKCYFHWTQVFGRTGFAWQSDNFPAWWSLEAPHPMPENLSGNEQNLKHYKCNFHWTQVFGKLHLASNLITSLPEGVFSHATQCKELLIHNNKITIITAGSFTGLKQLETLNLGWNQIASIPYGVFSHISQCKVLDLDGNGIKAVTAGSFNGLLNLVELILSKNLLVSLPQGVFHDLISLKVIKLYANQLTSLNPSIFSNLSQTPLVLWLSLPGWVKPNPWNCSSLCWLKHEEQCGNITLSGPVICSSGESWDSLQCDDQGGPSCCRVVFRHEKVLWTISSPLQSGLVCNI